MSLQRKATDIIVFLLGILSYIIIYPANIYLADTTSSVCGRKNNEPLPSVLTL